VPAERAEAIWMENRGQAFGSRGASGYDSGVERSCGKGLGLT